MRKANVETMEEFVARYKSRSEAARDMEPTTDRDELDSTAIKRGIKYGAILVDGVQYKPSGSRVLQKVWSALIKCVL